MDSYKILQNQIFRIGEYSIVPIRIQDRYAIMQWRNEQLYHLRQTKPLTVQDQDQYFSSVIQPLFDVEQPHQILFSYLKREECIGYGGLVHINWKDRNAEISFIINTKLESESFSLHWDIFLELIQEVAFQELLFHKIYTYAYDIRPYLYDSVENAGFNKEAVLKEHFFFESQYKNVLIHSKMAYELRLRLAKEEDKDITFKWATDSRIRKYSFTKNSIKHKEHLDWFDKKLKSTSCEYYILLFESKPIGSFRIDIENNVGMISYLLDVSYHGKGLGHKLLQLAEGKIKNRAKDVQTLVGYIMNENIASSKVFKKSNYTPKPIENNQIKYSKNLYEN